MSTATIQGPTFVPSFVADDEFYEIIDGQRVGKAPMGVFSVWIASQLHEHLAFFARTHNLGRAITEALFHLPAPINRDRRPDVAFVSYERWAKDRPLPATENAWDVVPNLAVEVVSPTDAASALQEKIEEYFRAGVQAVWVVHPPQQKIYVHRSPTQIAGLTFNDVLEGGTVLPGFRLTLAELFGQ